MGACNDGISSPVAALTLRPRDEYRADSTGIDDDFDPNSTGLTDTCIVEFRRCSSRQHGDAAPPHRHRHADGNRTTPHGHTEL